MRYRYLSIYTHLVGAVLLLLIVVSCKPAMSLINLNLASLYEMDTHHMAIKLTVNHLSDSTSNLTVNFNQSALLFNKNITKGVYEAKFKLSYAIYTDWEHTVLVDSGSVQKGLSKTATLPSLNFLLKTPKGKNYYLLLMIKDLNRLSEHYSLKEICKQDIQCPEYFTLHPTPYQDSLNHINSLKITHLNSQFPLTTKFYTLKYVLSILPYVLDINTFDNVNEVYQETSYATDTHYIQLSIPSDVIKLELDSNFTSTHLLHQSPSTFPTYTNFEDMLAPMYYLLDKQNYELLLKAKDTRAAFETFWLENNDGSLEKARKAIALYYSKITFVNEYFTTYKPGWATDKGMVFLVKGPPQHIKRTVDKELWYYGENNFSESEYYVFKKASHPLSMQNYVVYRNPSFKTSWDKGVYFLKTGKTTNW